MSSTIGKRGRGKSDASSSSNPSSSSTSLVVIPSKRSRTKESSASSTFAAAAAAAAAGTLSMEGTALTSLQSLLGPVLSQLQSMSHQLHSQGQQLQQLQSLSASISSLGASVSFMKEEMSLVKENALVVKDDVGALLRAAFPLTLTGGARPSNVLSVLYGAHGIGQGIFGFLDCKDGNNLRLVCHEMRMAVAAFPWNDEKTCIKGSLCSWRSCYPNARAAVVGTNVELDDADFRFFRGLRHLDVSFIETFTDDAFSHLSGLRYLDISHCTQLTDDIFPYLVGLETLVMKNCHQDEIEGAALEPLRGSVLEINADGCLEDVINAARAIAPRSMAKYLNRIATALPTGGSHVFEDGRSMNERQLYLECLRLYPQYSNVYHNLTLTKMNGVERICLPNGRRVNRRELNLEALRFNPRAERALVALSIDVTADESILLPDSRLMNKRALLLESLRYGNADKSYALTHLAIHASSADEKIALPDGRRLNQRELLLEALEINPENVFTLDVLRDTMTSREKVTLQDNRVMTRKQLGDYVDSFKSDD